MTSHDASARSDAPGFTESGRNQTNDRTAALVDGTNSTLPVKGVVSPTPPALGLEPDLAAASQARMNIDGVVGADERAQTTPITTDIGVPVEPSVRIGKSIPIGTTQPAGSAGRDVTWGDPLLHGGEESSRGEQTVCRRRPAQYAVLFAPTSAAPPPPASSRRPLLLAGLATGLMVASAGYVAMSKREPQDVTSPTRDTPQAAAAATADPPRMDDVSLAGQPEGVSHDERPRPDSEESLRTYALDLTVEPSNAWITLDGQDVGMGRVQSRLRMDGVEHTLVIGAPGHASRTLTFRDAPPPARVTLDANVSASSPSPSPRRRPVPEPVDKPRRGANGALILR